MSHLSVIHHLASAESHRSHQALRFDEKIEFVILSDQTGVHGANPVLRPSLPKAHQPQASRYLSGCLKEPFLNLCATI
jgi:hypothetical protein